MRAYVTAQIEDGSVKMPIAGADRPDDAEGSPAAGVVWSDARSRWRVRYTDENGEKHTKDFKHSDEAVAFARSKRQSEPLAGQHAMPLQDGQSVDHTVNVLTDASF